MRYLIALLLLGLATQCQALDFTIFVLESKAGEVTAVEFKSWKGINGQPAVVAAGSFTVYTFKDSSGKTVQVSLSSSAPYFTICE